jgi:hypothetical protein
MPRGYEECIPRVKITRVRSLYACVCVFATARLLCAKDGLLGNVGVGPQGEYHGGGTHSSMTRVYGTPIALVSRPVRFPVRVYGSCPCICAKDGLARVKHGLLGMMLQREYERYSDGRSGAVVPRCDGMCY